MCTGLGGVFGGSGSSLLSSSSLSYKQDVCPSIWGWGNEVAFQGSCLSSSGKRPLVSWSFPTGRGVLFCSFFFLFPSLTAAVNLHLCPWGEKVCCSFPKGFKTFVSHEKKVWLDLQAFLTQVAILLYAWTTKSNFLWSLALPPVSLMSA